jgi:predicted flap endonuclease-1-like 5' DNA nuclease
MPYQAIQFELGPDSLIQLGETMTRRWQETMADAQDTLAKSLESGNPIDAWSLQLAFGMRNAQRWFGPVGFGPEAAETPSASEPPPKAETLSTYIDLTSENAAILRQAEPEVVEADPDVASEQRDIAIAGERGSEAINAALAKENLQRIRGIGPAIARKLAARGIEDFVQIAALDPAAIADLDAALDLKGRIERDDWVGQAQMLVQMP